MIRLIQKGVFLINGRTLVDADFASESEMLSAKQGTMAYSVLKTHNTSDNMDKLAIRFDVLGAHDMTYMGVLQTAIACGIESFDLPFIMTDCHNSLCMMAGSFNEDDHVFNYSAVRKYGGQKMPSHTTIFHQYMRETQAGCGKMIIGADSHTRYGALGTIAIGEGAGEVVKQLVGKTYDISYPEIVLCYLDGAIRPGVGPHDLALTIIGEVFKKGFVKNRIIEFCGPGIKSMSVDFRNGVDCMTTEAGCLSSIWETDSQVEEFLAIHGRQADFVEMHPAEKAYYDRAILINLSELVPVIAMPFHPSNVYTIDEFNRNTKDILHATEEECNRQMEKFGLRFNFLDKVRNGRMVVDQGIVAGCAGGLYTNLCAVADILDGKTIGNGQFSMHVYPASMPIMEQMISSGVAMTIMKAGVDIRSAFCGPCFGAGDIPSQMGFSVRHVTRNFASRDGSKPKDGQLTAVALMDARSIAATAINGGRITPATDLTDIEYRNRVYSFDNSIYQGRRLDCVGRAEPKTELKMGPNITPIPEIPGLKQNLFLEVACRLDDPVTTTDELIPGGESTSYRSNLVRLADFTLANRDPNYVPTARAIKERSNDNEKLAALVEGYDVDIDWAETTSGSVVVSRKPGDGSAREYAATCQRVLGGCANICLEYATKRYRSNLINWGLFPFTASSIEKLKVGSYVFIPGLRKAVEEGVSSITGLILHEGSVEELNLDFAPLNNEERAILLDGCLVNHYRSELKSKKKS